MILQEYGLDMPVAVIEILILWGLFYYVLKAVKGTRAIQVVWFITLLYLLIFLCRILELTTVQWFLASAQLPIFVGLVILYAPELRRAVSDLTRKPVFSRRSKKTDNPMLTEVSQAVNSLSKKHIGALIVFERATSLQGFIDTGIKLESNVSSELLVSIFSPLTPLHDGAVIIRNSVIASAACLLPLSQREEIDPVMGTRHRAAVGLSEETDAITVVVSEETGGISIALNGRLTREIDSSRFQHILSNVLKGV